MTANDTEREVARALEQLRKADEVSAPSFHATLESARAGRASRRPAIGPALAAVALLVVIVGLVFTMSKHPPASRRLAPPPSSAEASLESWESPTVFLLETPGSEIWRGLPRLAEPPPSNLPADSTTSKKGVPS